MANKQKKQLEAVSAKLVAAQKSLASAKDYIEKVSKLKNPSEKELDLVKKAQGVLPTRQRAVEQLEAQVYDLKQSAKTGKKPKGPTKSNPISKKMSGKSFFGKKDKNARKDDIILSQDFLEMIKPLGNLRFYSDYFQSGEHTSTILTFLLRPGMSGDLPTMWGIMLIPPVVDGEGFEDVTAHLVTSYNVRPTKWVEDHISVASSNKTEGIDDSNSRSGSDLERYRNLNAAESISTTADEIARGSSYLDMSVRLLIKAPNKEILDAVIVKLTQAYRDRFNKASWVRFVGQQQDDYQALLQDAQHQLGENYQMTSRQMAGSYQLVTRGLEDPKGLYIGQLARDVNAPAVIWDAMNFEKLMVIASSSTRFVTRHNPDGLPLNIAQDPRNIKYAPAASSWAVHVAQKAILEGKRVVHVVMNSADVAHIGGDLSDSTGIVDLSKSTLNMFEGFGDVEDEITVFSTLTEKIVLMYSQLNSEFTLQEEATLTSVLEKFYIAERMWVDNASKHREQLRLVGLMHEEVPTLAKFALYLQNSVSQLKTYSSAQNQDAIKALDDLAMITNLMMKTYGDVFNTISTTDDHVLDLKHQVILDLGNLYLRKPEVMAAQFVNTLAYLNRYVNKDTVIIFHGMDLLDQTSNAKIMSFFNRQLTGYYRLGAKVVLAYDSFGGLVAQSNKLLENADVTLVGQMIPSDIEDFNYHLNLALPTHVLDNLTQSGGGDDSRYFLRLKNRNILFDSDVYLGSNEA